METTTRRRAGRVLSRLSLFAFLTTVVVYGAFALVMGVSELLFVFGVAPEMKHRAIPVVFAVHALAGAVALLAGPLPSFRSIRRRARVRAAIGRTYVAAVWIASVAAAANAIAFDVSLVAKGLFAGIAMLWFAITTIGMLKARARRFASQHEWMIRSYALSLFFVTFSLWAPALASTSLPDGLAYPLAQLLSGAINLAVAELWIRRTRRPAQPRVAPAGGLASLHAAVGLGETGGRP